MRMSISVFLCENYYFMYNQVCEKNSINKTVMYPVSPIRQIEDTETSNAMISSS